MTSLMPAAFFGHGSPMNTLEHNRFTEAWQTFGVSIPRPTAILMVSAHWVINATAVTAMERPRVIHDFYGFPDELFAYDYPAPGSPQLAADVASVCDPVWVGMDHDSWGLDHGAWSVLAHMFPEADIPVVQLSINGEKPLQYHLDLGARLAPLREQGVLILGSGNVVHNLRRIDWQNAEDGFDWAQRFDSRVKDIMTTSPTDIVDVATHPDYSAAVPTAEHFIPLLYIAGLAGAAGAPTRSVTEGCVLGSLSMCGYVLD